MKKRKLLTGLATAGAFSAGFGATVFPASAELRTLNVTLLDGRTMQITVNAAPGTPVGEIPIPGVNGPIRSVTEGAPATPLPVTPATPPAASPAPQSSDAPAGPSGSSGPTTPSEDVPEVVPKAEGQDQETSGQTQRRPRAGKDTSKAEGEEADKQTRALAEKAAADAVERAASPERQADGTPTAVDPSYSFSIPGAAPIGVPNFFIEKFRIPPFLLPIYQAAGIQYGVRWEVLAAINEIETDYGRNLNVSSAGALGWMQFMPATWEAYGVDANADDKKDPYNPVDAIFGAARYLKAAGAEKDLRKAIFAYNHADWYVESVLMRARLIGGLPADLVGSLTGLTQGHFPVHAVARYADDLSERDTKRRIARGRNASIPVEASARRKGIEIFAKAGSPVIAVQDAIVTALGENERLGRFVQIRDAYGNTYTYGGLKKLARAYPVPKEKTVTKAQIAEELDLPKDPKPDKAASAGAQQPRKAPAKAAKRAAAPPRTDVAKERLFANPRLPAAFANGGEEQLLNADTSSTTFKSYFTEVYGLDRSEVTIKPLKKGSKVIAGTILGRIGTVTKADAPHVTFEVRPAGRGAPRIDPKPILDGWKLLESTAVYRAAGKNPFFGRDAKNPSIGQILLMSKEGLQRRILADPRVEIYEGGRRDIRAGAIDRRVLATIEFLTASGLKPTITSLKSGRASLLTASGNRSAHPYGSAVDIAKINGIPISGHQGPGSITDITIRRMLTLQGTQKPNQIISLMRFDGTDNTFALADHADHIHVGFQPQYGSDAETTKQLDAVLKPSQWIKLIGRLGEIENPKVLTKPSSASITVKSKRASEAHAGE